MYPGLVRRKIDYDGLITFILSLLLILCTLFLPLVVVYIRALRIARAQPGIITGVDNLFVFGKKLINGNIDDEYKRRLDSAHDLIKKNPEIKLVLLGGASKEGAVSEARAGLDYLRSRGFDQEYKVQLEERSRNTLENLRHAQQLLFPGGTGSSPIILLTNRYHLPRSALIADSLGFAPVFYPAETTFPSSMWDWGKLLKETFYMFWFQTGKRWARIIRNQRMLDRVT
jgi:uncharacterized SAM-binding protein YcdF (DUF218 family)